MASPRTAGTDEAPEGASLLWILGESFPDDATDSS